MIRDKESAREMLGSEICDIVQAAAETVILERADWGALARMANRANDGIRHLEQQHGVQLGRVVARWKQQPGYWYCANPRMMSRGWSYDRPNHNYVAPECVRAECAHRQWQPPRRVPGPEAEIAWEDEAVST